MCCRFGSSREGRELHDREQGRRPARPAQAGRGRPAGHHIPSPHQPHERILSHQPGSPRVPALLPQAHMSRAATSKSGTSGGGGGMPRWGSGLGRSTPGAATGGAPPNRGGGPPGCVRSTEMGAGAGTPANGSDDARAAAGRGAGAAPGAAVAADAAAGPDGRGIPPARGAGPTSRSRVHTQTK